MALHSGTGRVPGGYGAATSAALRLDRAGAVRGVRRFLGARRVWRLVALTALVGALTGATLFEASLLTGPSVDAVPAAVRTIDAAHHAAPAMVSPSDRIAEALVAAEDGSFYTHNGVDGVAVIRAGLGFLTGSDAGGSTIEIQLTHLAFPGPTSGLWGRVHRVTLAFQLDTHYTKQAILSMYLDAAYFGHGYYGIAAASRGYFNATPAQLTWSQAALLAGLVQAPSADDPTSHPAAATARRGYVLQRLVDGGLLSQAQADSLAHLPLGALAAR